jgi:acyl-CoA thioester hydrolase
MAEPAIERRVDYPHFLTITTRWMDNDLYGHVNNVVYYSFFDTVINQYLIRAGGLDIHDGTVIGLAVETMCRFYRPLAYPDPVDAGLRVGKLGRTSVRYEIGLFAAGQDEPAATGHFVHVFVERSNRRPAPIPATIRSALAAILPSEKHTAG